MDCQRIEQIYQSFDSAMTAISAYVTATDDALKYARGKELSVLERLREVRSQMTNFNSTFGESSFSQGEVEYAARAMMVLVDQQRGQPDMLNRMGLVNLVALFDEVLIDLFTVAAESLPSAQETISELKRKGRDAIEVQLEYFKEKFDVDLLGARILKAKLVEIHATRNVLLHANGVVTQYHYIRRVPDTTYKVGDTLTVERCYFEETRNSLGRVALHAKTELLKNGGC